VNSQITERTSFSESQRLTRGERFVARACLVVGVCYLVFATFIFANEGRLGVPFFLDMWSPIVSFGLTAVVATHAKWKLVLCAFICFLCTVVLSVAGVAFMFGPPWR
jgi:hypothetical protein